MRRQRSTKIVATLGPASNSEEMIARLFEAGADIFRVNMSHTKHDAMRALIGRIRAVEKRFERPIGILADLQGPKLRLGEIEGGAVDLAIGDTIAFDLDTATVGSRERVPVPHPEVLAALAPGHALLIDDGKMRLRTLEASPERCVVVSETAGKLSSRKGISLPDSVLPVGALTPKDRSDLEAVLDTGVDWIALSFVQRPEDIAELRKIVRRRALILAKIEKPQAVQRLDAIMEAADALMVARGDLGVEMPLEKVPGTQKRITRSARRTGKPVVVATQMLESMITAPVPTRAEVSDVATAVFEGADAVMLSAESASGSYPIEAVETMNRIAVEVETDPVYRSIIDAQRATPEMTGADAIAASAHQITDTLNLGVICAWTASGSTAMRLARERPNATVLALTPNRDTARQLSLVWGVHPVVTKDASDIDDMAFRAAKFALREGYAKVGDRITVVAGMPFGTPGATNMVRITYVTADHAAKA
jgi:pyruvate kinase